MRARWDHWRSFAAWTAYSTDWLYGAAVLLQHGRYAQSLLPRLLQLCGISNWAMCVWCTWQIGTPTTGRATMRKALAGLHVGKARLWPSLPHYGTRVIMVHVWLAWDIWGLPSSVLL